MRIAASQDHAPSENGFILIEVLVSALILAIVAAAVLALLSSTTHSAASERTRSQAAALAQEDQARLRTMRLTRLNGLREIRKEIFLDGTEFTVTSQGTFVNAKSNEVNCSGEGSVADYIRVTSEVSSETMRTPVILRSIVSPSSGSLDQNHGIFSFSATNADKQALSGVSFIGVGPVNFSGQTDSTGCANFADLTAGSYSVMISANGLVNPLGETSTSKSYNASIAEISRYSLEYDVPGGVEPKFFYWDALSGVFRPGSTDSIDVYKARSESTVPLTVGTPGGTRSNPFKGPTNLFPFNRQMVVWAGACESNNSDPKAESVEKQKALAYVEIQPGVTAKPEIQLPALNFTLTSDGAPVQGARVTTQDVNSKCEYASKPIKRLYTTEAGGHLARTEVVPGQGEVVIPDAGMPWGKYKVCASALYKGSQRHVETSSAAVENLAAGTNLSLDLKNGTSGACSWP